MTNEGWELSKANLRQLVWRRHARIEAEADGISESGLEEALQRAWILVESYPEDPYGQSYLLLVAVDNAPVHVLVSPREGYSYLITAYRPDPSRWEQDFLKRKPQPQNHG